MTKSVGKIVRAPFFFIPLFLSMLGVLFIFAWVTVGAWFESLLCALGLRSQPSWLPSILGFVGYIGLGILLPGYLGSTLVGWPGMILAPLLVLGSVAWFGRW
jgi:hypothetical protein